MNHQHFSIENLPVDENFFDEWEKWKKRVPIPLDRYDLEPIPDDTFGEGWLGAMTRSVADSLETPIELPGFLGMGAVAAAIQGKCQIGLEPGFHEPLNLWLAVAMDPSNRKSTALKLMTEPIREWEEAQARIVAPIRERVMSERQTFEMVIHSRRLKCSRLVGDDLRCQIEEIRQAEEQLPKVPPIPRLTFNDATPEALMQGLFENDERLAFIDSEPDALFEMALGRYSNSPKMESYLKGWSGEGTQVDRKSGPPIILRNPLLTLVVAPQPSLLQSLSRKPGLVNRGFLARFLFAMPASLVGFRTLKPLEISAKVRSDYRAGLMRLIEFNPEQVQTIRLTPSAYTCWKDWQRETEIMMRPDGRLSDPALKSWCGKLAGNTARFAGVLHSAELAPTHLPHEFPVNEATMRRAVAACRALIDHSIAVHDLAVNDTSRSRAKAILEWLKNHPIENGTITVRELWQYLKGRSAFRRTKDVRSGLEVLAESDWLIAISKGTSVGRPSERFLVHPQIPPLNPQ